MSTASPLSPISPTGIIVFPSLQPPRHGYLTLKVSDSVFHACNACYRCESPPSADMNWTEGNLNRHSRARKGKETFLRQKEHFAKVRAGLLDANVKISPPLVSALAVPVRSPSSVRRVALQSTSSSRSSRNGDRLMASSYFLAAHAKLAAPSRLPDDDTGDSTRQKRRKLLLKGDWVGTDVQKPIEMGFMKPGVSRVSPWTAKNLRHPASKRKLRKLVGLANLSGDNRARPTAMIISAPTSLRQIKVRVGPYERALGGSSNASSLSKDPQARLLVSHGKPSFQPLNLRSIRWRLG